MVVLGTVALSVVALGAVLPTLVPIVIVWTLNRGVMSWLDQSQARQVAADVLAARLDALERRR